MELYISIAAISVLMVLTTATSIVSSESTVEKILSGAADPEYGDIFHGIMSTQRRMKRQHDYELEITDECKRLGYCPSVSNYPEELVKKLLDETTVNNYLKFNMDKLDEPLTETNTTGDMVSRMGGSGSEPTVPICAANDQIIYPQAAPDEGNVWRPIINPKDNPLQGLKVEICSNPGNHCSKILSLEEGYTSECQQKYVYRMVATYDQAANNIINRALKFPSCCSCVLHIVS